jgi:hypothetical protein
MLQERVWQGIQRGAGIGGRNARRLGQGGDAVAVAIEAIGARRTGEIEGGGIVGQVGVDALGEVVEQRVEAARRGALGDDLVVGDMQRGVDGLEVVTSSSASLASRARSAARPARRGCGPNQGATAIGTRSAGTRLNGWSSVISSSTSAAPAPAPVRSKP